MRLACLAVCLLACSSQETDKSPTDASSGADVTTETDASDSSLPVEASAEDAADTSIPPGPCGLTLVGPMWASTCQSWMDSNCCAGEKYCGNNDQCSGWVQCVDACGTSPPAGCVSKCGQTSILFGPAYNCMTGPPDGAPPLPSGCSWP